MPTKAELLKRLAPLKDDDLVAGSLWTAADIKAVAEQEDLPGPTEAEIAYILDRIDGQEEARERHTWAIVRELLEERG